MVIELPENSISTNLSYVLDPLPGLLKWLENICTEYYPAELTIDEEGYGKRFVVDRLNDRISFKIYEWKTKNDGALLLEYKGTKKELVKSFLNRLQSFSYENEDLEWSAEYRLNELPFERVREKYNEKCA